MFVSVVLDLIIYRDYIHGDNHSIAGASYTFSPAICNSIVRPIWKSLFSGLSPFNKRLNQDSVILP